jgi:hypothetical protein
LYAEPARCNSALAAVPAHQLPITHQKSSSNNLFLISTAPVPLFSLQLFLPQQQYAVLLAIAAQALQQQQLRSILWCCWVLLGWV